MNKVSTKENIVYVGDEVRLCNGEACLLGKEFVQGFHDDWLVTNYGYCPLSDYATPDGKPVTGFGGAKIELRPCNDNPEDLYHEPHCRGVVLANGALKDDYEATSWVFSDALATICKLYGPWIEEPTRADLKRRGLLFD